MMNQQGHIRSTCSHCGESFTLKADLNRHMRIHTRGKHHRCGLCGTSFIQKGHFTHHMLIYSEDKPHH